MQMDTALFTVATMIIYFFVLLGVSHFVARRGGNDAFFRGNRRSPWWAVAFGMIGASISGVSFVSVPGWVAQTGMTYLQMCLGFCVGYAIVAFVLLPLYYRLGLTSIYGYLGLRYGPATRRTGAAFFVVSKLSGAAARLYLTCLVLQTFVADRLGVSFGVTVASVLVLIWCYTRRSGIRTLVWTDVLQTLCLLVAVVGVAVIVARRMGLDTAGVVQTVAESPMSRIFVFDDWMTPQNFWKQLVSGAFVVIVMTGLDQDMMQKNLTCPSLRAAQKDMCSYGLAFVPVNLLFLSLGVLLYTFAAREGLSPLPSGDDLLPRLVGEGWLGGAVVVPFTVGIVAAAFSSADSALTSLTTSCCVDLLDLEGRGWDERRRERWRKGVHVAMAVAFGCCILLFRLANGRSVIDAIYVMASYTYGPLLGLYAFGLFTRRSPRPWAILPVAVAAPVLSGWLDWGVPRWTGYTFGYELLLLNGALAFVGLWLASAGREKMSIGRAV